MNTKQRSLCALTGVAGLSFVLAWAVAAFPGAGPSATPLSLGIEVAFQPGSTTDSYLCQAEIKDLSTGEVLSAPRVESRRGEVARIQTGLASGDILHMEVALTETGKEARSRAWVTRGTETVSAQTVTLRLAEGSSDGS